jgi:hypothetical protein
MVVALAGDSTITSAVSPPPFFERGFLAGASVSGSPRVGSDDLLVPRPA